MVVFKQGHLSSWAAARLRVKSIRGQLTFGLTITLVPCLVVGFYATNQYVRSRVLALTEHRLQAEAELISYGLRQWGIGISQTVEALTETPAFREVRVAEIQSTLSAIVDDSDDRLWRYWSPSNPPKLLAHTGSMTSSRIADAQNNQMARDYFQAARRGYSTYQVVLSKLTGQPCLNFSQPVFRRPQPSSQRLKDIASVMSHIEMMRAPVRADVSGVFVLCIPLKQLGLDTGLQDLFKDQRLTLLASDASRNFMRDRKGFDSAVILVSNSGQLLFPELDWNSTHIPNVSELSSTTLPELLPIAKRAMRGEEFFTSVSGGQQRYLVLTSRVDSAWSLILLLNERKAFIDVVAIGRLQVIVAALTLAIVLLIIAYRARAISLPISRAGIALQQMSSGDFDVDIVATTDDEIGGLLTSVQVTAGRLKAYLREVMAFAVTQKQIDTAKAIQKDFLLPSLPVDSRYDVQACSRPALEIGADWYDMVDAGDYAVLVVADVCDKGVPSALYMSVFRSLIRSKLLDSLDRLDCSERASAVICDSIQQTNSYMATNHNDSMMFATVFIAAVNKKTGVLDYVCAGHESPVIKRSTGIESLADVSGPAIGLFDGASYSVFTTRLFPGDAVVVYSDGLIDARSRNDEGWGIGRLRDLLATLKVESASQLMHCIISSVDVHMDGAEQFDDLTVMVFRWLGS